MDGVVGGGLSVRQARAVEAVVHKLLVTAVADTSERVRKTVLRVSDDASNHHCALCCFVQACSV